MRRQVVLFLLLLLLPLASLQAQEVLVCDGVSHFPIRDVLVIADGKNIGLTTMEKASSPYPIPSKQPAQKERIRTRETVTQ